MILVQLSSDIRTPLVLTLQIINGTQTPLRLMALTLFLQANKRALQVDDLQGSVLVEAAGIEPASADSQPSALHA